MATAALKRFDTEQDLTDYADELNQAGISPEIAVMDSSGFAALATLQAPGGDGWGFAYYTINDEDGYLVGDEDGGRVQPARQIGEGANGRGWQPAWPVYGIVTALR